MELHLYNTTNKDEWDNFVDKSRNGTFMNKRKFLSYHPRGKFHDASCMFYKKGKLLAVFPAALVDDKIISHPGASYGGLIISKDVKINDVNNIFESMIYFFSNIKNDIKEIIIRPPLKIYHKYPSEEIDFIMYKKGFTREIDLSTCIGLKEISSYQTKKSRQGVGQSLKRGVIVEESNDFESFHKLLTNNLKKHNAKPVHTVGELVNLKNRFPLYIKLYIAKKDNIPIGAGLIFIFGNVIHTQNLSMDYNYEKLRPINAVVGHIIKEYKHKDSIKYLNFGVSTEGFGKTINWNLFKFKENFGGRGVLVERWTKKLDR